MKQVRKFLILSHRYLGIATCLLAVMWFATGIVMMYAGGMPRLTAKLRVDRLAPLDLARVRLSPAEAAERAGAIGGADGMTLLTVMDRPAYRAEGQTIFADTGEALEEITVAQARTIASRFAGVPDDRVAFTGTITRPDQWTLVQSGELPLHRFRVDDGQGTDLYVSPDAAEVTLITNSRSRALAWVGTIPHWLYFTALRTNQPLWYRLVVWTSALVCVVSALGLLLGVVQFRKRKPFSLRAAIPYAGAMRWHYITGVIFGVFTLTWAFSGLLSMEPFEWTNATGLYVPGDAFTPEPADMTRFADLSAPTWSRVLNGRTLKELEFVRIQDEHYYVARSTDAPPDNERPERLHQPYYITGRAEPDHVLVSAASMAVKDAPFTTDSLMTRLRAAVPDVPITDYEVLTEYDSYYYSRGQQAPLPVLRVRFADPAATWVYIDPEMSQVLASIHRLNRVERWLYNGLHSLDFSFWYSSPLWDVGMIALLLGGLASSGIGTWIGIRRLRRGVTRKAGAWSGGSEILPAVEEARAD